MMSFCKNIVLNASVWTFVFLASGFLYLYVFIGHFFPDFYPYFSIADYISASLEHIRFAVIMVAINCFVYWICGGFFHRFFGARVSSAQNKKNNEMYRFRIFLLGLVSLCIISAPLIPWRLQVYGYLAFLYDPVWIVLIVVILCWLRLIERSWTPIVFLSLFSLSLYLFISLSLYSGHIIYEAKKDIYNVEKHIALSTEKIYPIETRVNLNHQYRTIFVNSNYYFMLSNDNKRLVIYPINKVDYTILAV